VIPGSTCRVETKAVNIVCWGRLIRSLRCMSCSHWQLPASCD